MNNYDQDTVLNLAEISESIGKKQYQIEQHLFNLDQQIGSLKNHKGMYIVLSIFCIDSNYFSIKDQINKLVDQDHK